MGVVVAAAWAAHALHRTVLREHRFESYGRVLALYHEPRRWPVLGLVPRVPTLWA